MSELFIRFGYPTSNGKSGIWTHQGSKGQEAGISCYEAIPEDLPDGTRVWRLPVEKYPKLQRHYKETIGRYKRTPLLIEVGEGVRLGIWLITAEPIPGKRGSDGEPLINIEDIKEMAELCWDEKKQIFIKKEAVW